MARVRLAGAGVAVVVGVACSGGCGSGRYGGGGCGSGSGCVFDGPTAAGVASASRMRWSSRSVAATVWPRRQCGSGSSVASAARWHRRDSISVAVWEQWQGSSSVASSAYKQPRRAHVARGVWQQRQMAAAGWSRPGMINQGVARAFARVRRPGVLTFAAISEVGVSGRRVDGGHSLNSHLFATEILDVRP